MRLTLSVLTLQDQAPFTSMTHTFDQSGGSVGRHQRASWVLLDDKKFLSGEHFSINCDGKDFFVVDTSTNGTFINDSLHPLGQNNSYLIKEKDQIRIGEYVIVCSIFTESQAAASSFPTDDFSAPSPMGGDSHDPFFSSKGHFSDTPSSTSNHSHNNSYAEAPKSSFVDPNISGSFGQANAAEASSDPFFSSSDSFSPNETPFDKALEENIVGADTPLNINTPLASGSIGAPRVAPVQPPVQTSPEVIANTKDEGDVFDFLDTDNTEEIQEKPPVESTQPKPEIKNTPKNIDAAEIPVIDKPQTENIPEVKVVDTPNKPVAPIPEPEKPTTNEDEGNKPVASESEALKMFLKGAGITKKHLPSEVSAEVFETIGYALKEVLQGTIELLKARAETKNHLHLDRTIIGRVENNPLKFMPNAEQVIVHLLTSDKSDKTYTPLDKALEEAFDDVMAHQFAMTVATQSALKSVIKQHFSPKNLADNIAKDHPISSRIPLQRQAKLWSMFESLYDDVEKEATESFERLLDNEIGNAYEKQLMELKSLRINKSNNDFPE